MTQQTEMERIAATEVAMRAKDAPEVETPPASEPAQIAEPAGAQEGDPAAQIEGEGSPGDGRKPLSELSELDKAQHAFQRKTNKLTRRIGERDMRIADLEERLASLTVQEKPQQVHAHNAPNVQAGEPTLEDHGFDPVAFNRAHYQWMRTQEKQQEEAQGRIKRFKEKETAFVAEHPDYFEIATAAHVPITEMVAEALLEADDPPAIAYYLAQHLDEAHAIAQMTPINAARAIGRIEAKLSAPPSSETPPSPPRFVTKAPPVAASVQATSSATTPLERWTVDDHIRAIRASK